MRLTRRTALKGAAAGATVALAPKAFAAPSFQYDLEPLAVGDGVWMIEGLTEYFSTDNGGAIVNCVLFESDAGMVIVDTGSSRRYGEALAKIAASMSVLGVAAIFNTHHHPDHFFGNQVFADKPIYALGATREAAERDGDAFSDNMYRLLGDWMRGTEVVPPNTVIEQAAMTIGGRAFRFLPMAGHTAADLVIQDVKTGIVVGGDLLFLDRAPTTPTADLAVWRKSLAEISTLDASAHIPGHGPFDRQGRSVAQTSDYLDWLEKTLSAAALNGKDMVEIMREPLPERFAAMGAMPQEFERSVAHLYADIEKDAMPLAKG